MYARMQFCTKCKENTKILIWCIHLYTVFKYFYLNGNNNNKIEYIRYNNYIRIIIIFEIKYKYNINTIC